MFIHRACPGVRKVAQLYTLRHQPNHPRGKPGGFQAGIADYFRLGIRFGVGWNKEDVARGLVEDPFAS